jgi:hypothetical protein
MIWSLADYQRRRVDLAMRYTHIPDESSALAIVSVKNLQAPVAITAVSTILGERMVSMSYDKVCCHSLPDYAAKWGKGKH